MEISTEIKIFIYITYQLKLGLITEIFIFI